MSTQLFLTSALATAVGGPSGSTNLACSILRGGGSVTMSVATTSGGDNIALPNVFWWRVGAGSITGNVTANIRGKENTLSVNAGAGIRIEHYDSTGTTLKTTLLANKAVPSTITEYSTSDAAKALAATALTTGTSVNGDLIKVIILAKAFGTMGTDATGVTNSYNGASSGAAGDTSLVFATTLPTYQIPGIVQRTTGFGTGTADMVVTFPSALTPGNAILIVNSYHPTGDTFTPPAGLTSTIYSNTADEAMQVSYRIVQSGDSNVWTFTHATTPFGDNGNFIGYEILGPIDPAFLDSAISSGYSTAPASTAPSTTAVTPSSATTMLFEFLTVDTNSEANQVTGVAAPWDSGAGFDIITLAGNHPLVAAVAAAPPSGVAVNSSWVGASTTYANGWVTVIVAVRLISSSTTPAPVIVNRVAVIRASTR